MPTNYNKVQLDTPTVVARKRKFIDFDADAIGVAAERIARFLGTGKYLMWQTIIVIIWVLLNIGAFAWQWDPYPFILLNLAFSTQAAYAAPLILLAQNRQDDRDRLSLEEDRRRTAETKADTEFLTREVASIRISVGDMVTRDYLRRELEDLTELLQRIEDKLDDHRYDPRNQEDSGAPIDERTHFLDERLDPTHGDDRLETAEPAGENARGEH